jgi:hypothetical protein
MFRHCDPWMHACNTDAHSPYIQNFLLKATKTKKSRYLDVFFFLSFRFVCVWIVYYGIVPCTNIRRSIVFVIVIVKLGRWSGYYSDSSIVSLCLASEGALKNIHLFFVCLGFEINPDLRFIDPN